MCTTVLLLRLIVIERWEDSVWTVEYESPLSINYHPIEMQSSIDSTVQEVESEALKTMTWYMIR